MQKTELSVNDEETITVLRNGKGRFYDAGFNGETFKAFPNLTADTTAEEELQMVDKFIDKVCKESGCTDLDPKTREVMRLLDKMLIVSYRDGVAARNLSKECLHQKGECVMVDGIL